MRLPLRSKSLAISLSAILVVACTTTPKDQSTLGQCTPNSIEELNQARELKQRAYNCKHDVEAYAFALNRLNQLQPPVRDQVSLQPVSPIAEAEQVVFETEVFFEVLEAYPSDLVFDKLADLTSRVNQGFAIRHVQIIAGADRDEMELKSFDIARRRATLLKRYFVGAGIPEDKVFISERQPNHPQTPEGMARDRVAEIMVVILIRKATRQ